jgi:hypothetical protein
VTRLLNSVYGGACRRGAHPARPYAPSAKNGLPGPSSRCVPASWPDSAVRPAPWSEWSSRSTGSSAGRARRLHTGPKRPGGRRPGG